MRSSQLYINGAFLDAADGSTLTSINPATQEAVARCARRESTDIEAAVRAAREAFDHGPWPDMSRSERSALLKAISNTISRTGGCCRGDHPMGLPPENSDLETRSRSCRKQHRRMGVARRLRAGTVWINEWHPLHKMAPFGGYRQSGIGREFGVEGMREYCESKHIHIDEVGILQKKPWYGTVVPRT